MRFFNTVMRSMFSYNGCYYKDVRYPHKLATPLLKYVRNSENENVLKIGNKYPFIINHSAFESNSPFPLSVLIETKSVALIKFFLTRGASTRLIRTSESTMNTLHQTRFSHTVDDMQKSINNSGDESIKEMLERQYALETSVLTIKNSIESTSPEDKAAILFEILSEPSVGSLMHVPVCDGYANFNYSANGIVSSHERVTGIPSELSLKEFLIKECNKLPEDKKLELNNKLGSKLEFDFATHVAEMHF